MKKKLEIGLVAVLCLLLWATEMVTGWFSAHFPRKVDPRRSFFHS